MRIFRKITLFSIRLLIIILVVFVIHTEILRSIGYAPYQNLIIEGYCANVLLAIFIFVGLSFSQHKFGDQLGFLFMVGSLIKFAVFFLFFSPHFREDGDISKLEFLSFFVPYLFCLFLETLGVVKILNSSKKK
jgi:hypothetical protein